MDARAEYVQAGRNVDSDFDANVLLHTGGPGPFQGVEDVELAWAINVIALNGFADAEASNGSGDSMVAAGPFILRTDAQGFRSLHTAANADDAVTLVEAAWQTSEEDD